MEEFSVAKVREMLAKATPGPWECDERVGCISVHPMQNANCICDVVDQVAYWNGFMKDGKWDVKESDSANARLIAAAPTLLAAACDRIKKLERAVNKAQIMAETFIAKVETGHARSVETYKDALNVRDALSALDADDAEAKNGMP